MKSQSCDSNSASSTVGRPREFDEAEVLDNVMLLFWQHGYEATGLKDIEAATGLAKGSIYKAFQSKHNLYLQSLKRYESVHVDQAVQALTTAGAPRRRLDGFLSAPIVDALNDNDNKGCFLCNASADRADIDRETRDLVGRGFKKLSAALAVLVAEVKPDWSEQQTGQAAQMLMSVYAGLRIMSRARVDIQKLEAAKAGAFLVLD